MKKLPKVTVKHSSELTKADVNSYNKVQQKLRDNWMQLGQTQEQVDKMFPLVTLEQFTSKPGFYGKFGGSRSRGWEGPWSTREQAHDAVSEIAFETTFS